MSRLLAAFSLALAVLFGGLPAAAQSIGYSPNTLPLSGSCGVVTVSTPCLDLTQTWNNVATTFTGLKFNVTDTASAAGSLLMDLQADGVSKFRVGKGGGLISSAGVYHYLGGLSSTAITILSDGSVRISNSAGTNFIDLTASGSGLATLSGGLIVGGAVQVTAGSNLNWNGRGAISQAADGVYTFTNAAATNSVSLTVGASGLATFTGTLTSANSVWAGINSGVFIQGRSGFSSGADGTFRIQNNAGTITTDITLSGASAVGGSTATFGGNLIATGNVLAGAANALGVNGRTQIGSPSNGVYRFGDGTSANYQDVTLGSGGANTTLTFGGGIKTTGATFALQTATTLTDNAAAQVATMTNGPTAGNPTKWIAINDNGTTRYIPAW